jgi:hypothetical protein
MHSNVSTPNLSKTNLQQHDEYELSEHGQKVPMAKQRGEYFGEVRDDQHSGGHAKALGAGIAGAAVGPTAVQMLHHDDDLSDDDYDDLYQNQQTVPQPLKYVPYETKRGLSPIQSVSGYTDADEQERLTTLRNIQSSKKGSYSTLSQSPQKRAVASLHSEHSDPRNYDFKDVRRGGLTDSELTQEGDDYWEEQHQINDRARELDTESYQSSPRHERYKSGYTEDSEWQDDKSGHDVRDVGANADYYTAPLGVESAVASLVNASAVSGQTGDSRSPLERQDSYDSRLSEQVGRSGADRKASYASYDEGSEANFTVAKDRDLQDTHSPMPEYELDENGRKITMPIYKQAQTARQSPLKEKAIATLAGAAAGAGAATLANRLTQPSSPKQQQAETTQEMRPQSFAERAKDFVPPSPRHSVDRFSEQDEYHMVESALPNANDPMPHYAPHYGSAKEFAASASYSDIVAAGNQNKGTYSPSLRSQGQQHGAYTPSLRSQISDTGFQAAQMGLMDAHQPMEVSNVEPLSQMEHHNEVSSVKSAARAQKTPEPTFAAGNDEWQRTSEERKRDTLVTNPYENQSPITLLGGERDRTMLGALGYEGIKQTNNGNNVGYSSGSPLGIPKDEGYISAAPNARSAGGITPEPRARGVGFTDAIGMGPGEATEDDPFYTPRHQRHISGMSSGMDSPIYDSVMGSNRNAIKDKDIIALMDHVSLQIHSNYNHLLT